MTREMAEAERLARDAELTIEQLETTLQQALTVASTCHQHYQPAPPHVRRQINQGFLTKLLIDQDGSVERAELTEPFAALLTPDWQATTRDAQGVPDALDSIQATETHRPPRTVTPAATRARGTDVRQRCWSERLGVIAKPTATRSPWVRKRRVWCPRQDSNLRRTV